MTQTTDEVLSLTRQQRPLFSDTIQAPSACRRMAIPAAIALLLGLHVTIASLMPSSPLNLLRPSRLSRLTTPACTRDLSRSSSDALRQIRTPHDVQRLLQVNVHFLTYVHAADILIMTMPKAGTSTVWQVFFRGLTGRYWSNADCGIVHERRHPCWKNIITPLEDLPSDKQLHVLTSNYTLRVGVQREPFSRLMSAYKSKFTCEASKFRTSIKGKQMHFLRKNANLPPGPSCMNISEYAEALDTVRRNVGNPGYPSSVFKIDVHIRPQEFLFGVIDYDLVLDASDLSNETLMGPIFDRLPFPEKAKEDTHVHNTGDLKVLMDEKTAAKLHRFANLSHYGPVKYQL